MVEHDAAQLGLHTQGRLNGVSIRQHDAFLQSGGHVKTRRAKPHTSISRFKRFNLLSVGQRVRSVPPPECTGEPLS